MIQSRSTVRAAITTAVIFLFCCSPGLANQNPPPPSFQLPPGVKLPPGFVMGPNGPMRAGAQPAPGKSSEKKKDGKKKDDKSKKDKKDKGDKQKHDPSKPVTPPAKPLKDPDPKELEINLDADGKVKLDFNGQPWPGVLQWLAKISKQQLVWREAPGDYCNLVTQRRYTVDEVRDMINSLLLDRGYTLVQPHPEILKLVSVKKLTPSLVPRVRTSDLDSDRLMPHDYVRVSFRLKKLVADKVAEELEPLKSASGKIESIAALNRLDVMDTVKNLREIAEVINLADDENCESPNKWCCKLKHRRASEVIKQIKELLGESSGPSMAGMNPQQRAQLQAQMAAMQAKQKGKKGGAPKGGDEDKVRLLDDPRTNSIIVYAPPDKMVMIKETVAMLDKPLDPDPGGRSVEGMQIYYLSSTDPDALVKILQEIGGLKLETRLEVDHNNNAIIAYACEKDHRTILKMIEKLDGTGRHPEVIPLRRLEADYVAGSIQHVLFGGNSKEKKSSSRSYWDPWSSYSSRSRRSSSNKDQFRVDADVEHNQLLLWANKVEIEAIRAFLIKLGEPLDGASNPNTCRVLDAFTDAEAAELLEQLQKAWTGDNKLDVKVILPEPSKSEPEPKTPTAEPDLQTGSPAEPPIRFAQYTRRVPEKTDPKKPASTTPPPIKITRDALGRLVISSKDTAALDQFEALIGRLAPPRNNITTFRLKNAWPDDVVRNLKELFKSDIEQEDNTSRWERYWYDIPRSRKDDEVRLSKRRKLTFIYDLDSRSVVVKGADPEQLKLISEMIAFYDNRDEKINPANLRKEGVIQIRYSKATCVAKTLKEVYRDLLSENDKEFENKKGNNRRRGYDYWYPSFGDDDEEPERAPRFKGLLSIGVDEMSNSLIISAPAGFYDKVVKLIHTLDELSKPSVDAIDMTRLQQNLTAKQLQEALNKILGQQKTQNRPPDQNQHRNRRDVRVH